MNQVCLREVVKSDDDRRFEISVSSKRGRAVEVWTMQAATQQLKTQWVARIKKLLMRQFFSIRRTHQLLTHSFRADCMNANPQTRHCFRITGVHALRLISRTGKRV